MRESLLPLLCSPVSGCDLELEVFESKAKEIIAGKLFADDEEYPIINGVPRLLPPALLNLTLKRYPEFTARYSFASERGGDQADPAEVLKHNTLLSFGIQWNTFPEMYAEWKQSFISYFAPYLAPGDFAGRSVLDCGCGFGRHLRYAAEFEAERAVGFDLSFAVDAAYRNTAAFENAHVVQADIYNLPFKQAFDIAYCVGVLQHLPDAPQAVSSIAKKVQPGGMLFSWLYGPRPASYHLVVDNLRKFTRQLSPAVLYRLTFMLALCSYGGLCLPRLLLERIGLDKAGEKIPFSRYSRYPFRVSHADWYDRLAAPKTVYFSQDEVEQILQAADLDHGHYLRCAEGTWKLIAERLAPGAAKRDFSGASSANASIW